jgi:pimeloyl-ACP methyl ester carboxylesterase
MDILVDGIRLDAKLEMPENNQGSCPLAIVVHGLTGNKEEAHILAAAASLRECGVATLRVDMYGHGKSDGDFVDHTLYKWVSNGLRVVDYVRGLDFVDEIFCVGHSQGALLTILLAGMVPDHLAAIAPLSPAVSIIEIARTGRFFDVEFDPDHVPDVFSFHDKPISGNYIRVAQTIDVNRAIDAYAKPVLIVHGTEDTAVDVSFGIAVAKRYENAELVLVEGDDHCFHRHLDKALDAVGDFFRRQLERGTCH